MDDNFKEIGRVIDVNQDPPVTESVRVHQEPENYLQKFIPQNGGEIQASELLKPTPGVNPFKNPESLQKFKLK